MAKQLKINHIGISVHVNYDDATKEVPTNHNFNDSLSLNFGDEAEMNRALTANPDLAELIPKIIKKLISAHDPENKAAKKLLSSIGQ